MSQWGSQGAALAGVTYDRILATYYPGTAGGSAGGPIAVRIDEAGTARVEVLAASGLEAVDLGDGAVWQLPAGPTRWRVVLEGTGAGFLEQQTGGGWSRWTPPDGRTYLAGVLRFRAPAPVAVVLADGSTRAFRGVVDAVGTGGGKIMTVNTLPLEEYLWSVVPAESPPSWRAEALKAQAVAARTYAVYKRERPGVGYQVCSTTACQVYRGVSTEAVSTTAAVGATAGQIRTYAGAAALTEFSASNGGWSAAGGVPYLPAQADPWDAAGGTNPVHTWTTTVSQAALTGAFGVGTVTSVRVLARDGRGDWGGRVTSVAVDGTSGSATVTGDVFRTRLGLRSTWWVGPAQKYNLARTATDPRVWVTSDTQKFPVLDLAAYAALSKLGPLAYVSPADLAQRVSGPPFGRFAVAPDSRVWYLDGGHRSYVVSCDLVWAFGQHCSALPTLTAEQTAVFDEGPRLQVFVKARTADAVYVMWGGQKRHVTRWSDLIAVNGGHVPAISVLEPETVAAFPTGPRMLAPGSMVKSPTNDRVVLVDGNHRSVPLETFSAASALGLGALEVVDAEALAAYPAWTSFLVPTLRCPTGAFVGVDGSLRPASESTAAAAGAAVWMTVDAATCTALRASTASPPFTGPLFVKGDSDPRVYLVTDDVKRWVTSWSRLVALAGTSSPTIVPFAPTPLSTIPTGPDA